MTCANTVETGPMLAILNEKTEKMVGEVLTVLEAVIPGDRQTEKTKSIIKKILWGFNKDVTASVVKMRNTEE